MHELASLLAARIGVKPTKLGQRMRFGRTAGWIAGALPGIFGGLVGIAILTSPKQFQSELNLAGGGGGAGDGAGGAGEAGEICCGGRGEDDEVGDVEIGAAQEIEDFGAELEVEAFADGGFF